MKWILPAVLIFAAPGMGVALVPIANKIQDACGACLASLAVVYLAFIYAGAAVAAVFWAFAG